jgi:succinate dehydrogenase/fumarate reductase-like Fe-S protein
MADEIASSGRWRRGKIETVLRGQNKKTPMVEQKKIKVDIKRSSGALEGLETHFEVPLEEGMSVLNALEYISRNLDPTLAFYSSCRIGKCMGCVMKINGERGLACTTVVEGDIRLEPDDRSPLIRDLVVDLGDL